MRFARTVQDDVRKIEVADPNELRGLPADFLERFGVREQRRPAHRRRNPSPSPPTRPCSRP